MSFSLMKKQRHTLRLLNKWHQKKMATELFMIMARFFLFIFLHALKKDLF